MPRFPKTLPGRMIFRGTRGAACLSAQGDKAFAAAGKRHNTFALRQEHEDGGDCRKTGAFAVERSCQVAQNTREVEKHDN